MTKEYDVKANYYVEHKVGCLIVARLCSMGDVQQVAYVQRSMTQALERTAGKAILCADWGTIDVFSQDVAEAVVAMLSLTNPKILRSAILLSPRAATFNLQAERVVRDAGNPARRTFRDPTKLLTWCAEYLTPEELQAATEFFKAGEGSRELPPQ